jgi:hypothetical protein
MKNINSEEFKEAIGKAKSIYCSLPKEIFCPALNEKIFITRSGWEHFVAKPRRTKEQKYWRAKCFQYIRVILEKTTTIQRISLKHAKSGNIKTFSFISVEGKRTVEIVVRQVGNQAKHFYSVVYKGTSPRIIE